MYTFEEAYVEAELSPGSIEEWLSIIQQGKKIEKGTRRSDLSIKVKKHLSALGWIFWYAYKGKRRELRYKSPNGKWFYSLATACISCVDQRKQIVPKSVVSCSPRKLEELNQKRNRVEEDPCSAFEQSVHESVVSCSPRKLDVLNQKRKIVEEDPCSALEQSVPKSVVSCFPRKLDVLNQKRNRVEEDSCSAFDCDKAVFKEEASSDYIKIVLNIEISNQQQRKRRKKKSDDGFSTLAPSEDKREETKPRTAKSLKKILQVMEKKNEKEEKESLKFLRKDSNPEMNCDVCCVCHWGGDLLLCDGCPSAFHHSCLGLSNFPEEDLWFCPCCCCNICGSMESQGNSKLMSCEQCQNRFHLKCLKQEESCLVSPRGWFCSKQCSRVFTALESLLGCKVPLGHNDLVWTLMRAPNDGEHYHDEQISKLNSAVEILHQGFEPTKDPFSGKDLVEELIFRRDENGVGRGFYTVLIERNNVPITVATLRVDKDVAEIPLVSTLPNYRRSGMCKALMDELEKQMSKIGVYKLVLPAATDALTTWTKRFGFSVVGSSERLELVKHGMLDFDGSVMCHKFLMQREEDSSLTT